MAAHGKKKAKPHGSTKDPHADPHKAASTPEHKEEKKPETPKPQVELVIRKWRDGDTCKLLFTVLRGGEVMDRWQVRVTDTLGEISSANQIRDASSGPLSLNTGRENILQITVVNTNVSQWVNIF